MATATVAASIMVAVVRPSRNNISSIFPGDQDMAEVNTENKQAQNTLEDIAILEEAVATTIGVPGTPK